jgi:CRISPR-associated protein Csb2
MAFAIVADFPLGKYVGSAYGTPERHPTPARLHAALLCAAAQGSRAEVIDGALVPRAEDMSALEWLERHPPSGVRLPAVLSTSSRALAYRDLGLLEKGIASKKAGADAVTGVAVDGVVAWTWDEEPPGQVAHSLGEICADVPYLGSADSPVRLTVGSAEPTHVVDESASLFAAAGPVMEIPAAGRTKELTGSHVRARVPRSEVPVSTEVERAAVRNQAFLSAKAYRQLGAAAPDVSGLPWTMVMTLPFRVAGAGRRLVKDHQRLACCVGLHRALISVIGDGASAVVTGKSLPRARPSNHLAIHVLDDSSHLAKPLDSPQAFLLMLPAESGEWDLMQLLTALSQLKVVRVPGQGMTLRLGSASTLTSARGFWAVDQREDSRVWVGIPAAVPDTRPVHKGWTFGDAFALSVGLTWRDQLSLSDMDGEQTNGRRMYEVLAQAARGRGVEALSVEIVASSDVTAYVHKTNTRSLVRPYRFTARLGLLLPNDAVAAVGQSRHLGGGLLVPAESAS